MNLSRKIAFSFASVCTLIASARALDWNASVLTFVTTPFQTEQDAVFEFTNGGSKPVTIREIGTNCACLFANSDLKTYAPGSKGRITARFAVGDRDGLYERMITVVTDEPDSPARLTLKIEVPPIALVTPRSVSWLVHDELVEKSVEITTDASLEIVFSNAQPTNSGYEVRLEPLDTGKHYRLHIKPISTDLPVSAAIRITGREKSGRDVLISAYATVH